ncbi:MAG: helix-hairpin-helix domain-containing protein [Candidatus Roizmanbacteria bacterium]
MEKLLKKLKKYRVEAVLLTIAFLIAVVSLLIYLNTYQNETEEEIITNPVSQTNPTKIFVDISGSVNKPDLYEASNDTRLKEIIKKAGDLSGDADKSFFARNFNLARIVSDQEKIYIPSVWEVNNGYFVENQQTLNYISQTNNYSLVNNDSSLINLNSATIEQLDTLPGVGKITAQKIIDNRPFGALQELIDKKIVNKTVFENIKGLVVI